MSRRGPRSSPFLRRLSEHAVEQSVAAGESLTTERLVSLAAGSFSVDGDWRLVSVSAAAGGLLGRVPDELVGEVLWEVLPGMGGTEFERVCRRAVAEQRGASCTARFSSADR
jgi:PAS domain-containing protein